MHPELFWATDMESPTKEIEEFESTALKYLQPEQIEKIWLRLRGLWVYLHLLISASARVFVYVYMSNQLECICHSLALDF